MIIKPKIRGFICTNSHPVGCATHVQQQIDFVKAQDSITDGPKNVLVIGASTGYGLASRITSAFGCGAKTLGIFFEKEGSVKRTASAGWYNTAAFQQAAEAQGLWSKNINGDAFSHEIKDQTIEVISKEMGKIDLVIYSLAAPRRTDPDSGEVYQSTLKPIGQVYNTNTLNIPKHTIEQISIEPANQKEMDDTVKVMGGEDWQLWLERLQDADLLAENCQTVAYTYIGKELTAPIYGKGTIGKAKEDLDRAAQEINAQLAVINGKAYVASLKALVTQASSAIPVMPLYISLVYRIMKREGTHEGCAEQIYGLFNECLYGNQPSIDEQGRFRMDGKELADHVQAEVAELWPQVTSDNIDTLTDYLGYQKEFLRLFGFGLDQVDYQVDVNPQVAIGQLLD